MEKPLRGDLWHVFFEPAGSTAGHKSTTTIVSVIQSNGHRYGKTVLCVPLTTNLKRERPYGILIQHDTRNNLTQSSVAMPWLALSVDTDRFLKRIGKLQQLDLDRIVETLFQLLST